MLKITYLKLLSSKVYTSFIRHTSRTSIIDLKSVALKENNTCIKGWVRAVRKMKQCIFVDVNDGSTFKSLQIVIPEEKYPPNLTFGSSVEVEGVLVKNNKDQLELIASACSVVGECQLKDYPFAPRKTYENVYYRQYLHLRPQVKEFSSLLRLRSYATSYIHRFFEENGFFQTHSPILTSNDCEGAGEVFSVTSEGDESPKVDENNKLFDETVYLTVSGQLHLEVMARSLGKVYNFGPTFRAENSKSRLHLSEFYMVEAESAFVTSVEDVTNLVENLVRYVTEKLLDEHSDDVHICRKMIDSESTIEYDNLENTVGSPYKVISYNEAARILEKNRKKLKTQFTPGGHLGKEHELFLVKYNNHCPLFIVEWPPELKPFYMKTSDQDKVCGFDLLCPNVGEMCGGSLREDDPEVLTTKLERHNLLNKLSWYLELRKFGGVPTGGFGLGFERYIQVLLCIPNIKDTIPFPRWPHNCKL